MRKFISLIFFIPASIFLNLAELVSGEHVTWRAFDVINNTHYICSKCGHEGELSISQEEFDAME